MRMRASPSSSSDRSSPGPGSAAASALLHLAVLLALLVVLPERRLPVPPPSYVPTIALRLIETKGPPAKRATVRAKPRPPVPPQPAAAPIQQQASHTAPAPARPSPARSPAPPRMEINLGGGDSPTNAIATGPHIVPARPDQQYHNEAPIYPAEAAAFGEQGAVVLLVQVGSDGGVTGIEVVRSAGRRAFDDAARDAVARWHFIPALRDGVPVASAMKLRIVFQLTGLPGPRHR